MKTSRRLFFTLAVVSLIASSIGCYTLLKHPRVQIDDRTAPARDGEAVGFADDCSACHNLAGLSTYHPAVPPPRRFISPAWGYYYDNPWWIPYYTPIVPGGADGATTEEQKKRPFDRRHLSRQDETSPSTASTPEPSANPGTIAKPADSGDKQVKPQQQDTNKREEKRSGESQGEDRRKRKP